MFLGFAGAIPFAAMTGWIAFGAPEQLERAFVYYSAMILSFLGGIRWGAAATQSINQRRDYALSVIPSLAAWVALLAFSFYIQLAVLLLGHLITAVIDGLLPPAGQLPWLRRLRLQLSSLVLISHAVLLTLLL